MSYLADLVFPKRIAMGAQRSPRWSTTLLKRGDGRTYTLSDWEDALHEFDLSLAVRVAEDYDVIVQHFHAARGRRHTFPFWDPLDYLVTQARGVVIDRGEDSPTTTWQLAKRYGSGASAWNRRITRPRAGVTIYRTRGGSTTDITSSSTVSLTTGQVTFGGGVYLPGSDVLAWAGQFDVPCRYDTDALPSLIVDKRPGRAGMEGLLVRCDSIRIVEDREGDGS